MIRFHIPTSQQYLGSFNKCFIKPGYRLFLFDQRKTFFLVWILLLTCANPSSILARDSQSLPPWKIAKKLNLIPTPRYISLGKKHFDISHFQIVRTPDERLANTGANEINRQITELGGKALPISSRLGDGPAIVLATVTSKLGKQFADEVNISTTNPGEQGYVIEHIEYNGQPLIVALGSDKYGMLYAGITLCHLIQQSDTGIELLEASVRDAPAFKRRSFGRIQMYNNPNVKKFIRYLGQLKVNYLNIRTDGWYNSQGEEREERVKQVRALTDLAHDYGIHCKMGFMTHINEVITDQEWKKYGGVKRREGKRWYSWSALPVHQRKAKMIADFIKDTGINYMRLHVVDGGGYIDPESWSQRSDKTRQMYGDNHAKATATMVNVYRKALKKVNPDAEFEMVPYPYHYQFAIPNFPEKAEKFIGNMPGQWWTLRMQKMAQYPDTARMVAQNLRNLHQQMEKLMPDDVLITFREGGPEEFAAAGYLWKDHPLDVWAYLYRIRAWLGMWEPQDRLIKTWYRPSRRDMFFNAMLPRGWGAVRKWVWAASGAEYTWNTNLPDAEGTFTVEKRYYDAGVKNSTPFQKENLIPRVVHFLWGNSGAAFKDLLADNVSFTYLSDPEERVGSANRERFLDPYRYYEEQVEAVKKSRKKINRLINQLDQQEKEGNNVSLREQPVRYELAMNLYWTVNMAAIKGQVQLAWLKAQRFAKYTRPMEAQTILETLLEKIPELKQQYEAVQTRINNDSKLAWRPEKTEVIGSVGWSGGGFRDIDLDQYEKTTQKKLDQLKAGDYNISNKLVD